MKRTNIPISQISTNEKLKWIFERLMVRLNPTTVGSKRVRRHNCQRLQSTYTTSVYLIASCNFEVMATRTPYPDIKLEITEDLITITGTNFKYQFPPAQIMTIWMRLIPIL